MLGIYCRTSKSREEKYTLDNQREAGIKCAGKLGLGFRVYVDDGISGTLDESVRDGLSDLFRDIKENEITHVYCIDQSRIERDTRTWEFFVAICINNNIGYYPGGSYFDLNSATNIMFAKLMSVVNAYYSEITSKKVRLANAKKVLEGKTHGMKPYGYKRDSKNNFEIYEPEAKYVRLMYKLSLKGMGTYTIANYLNDKKIPTKFSGNFKGEIKRKNKYSKEKTFFDKSKIRWRGNVVYDILKNEIYKGVRKWNRYEDKMELIAGKLEKKKVIAESIVSTAPIIVSPDLWEKVNQNFVDNKKNVGKKAQYKYLLNELVYCVDCSRQFVGKKRLASGDNAYKCKGKIYPHPHCKNSRGININKLDSFIIKHLFKSKSLKKMLLAVPEKPNEKNGLQRRIVNERKKLKDIEVSLKLGYKRLLNPKFTNDKFIEDEVETLKNSLFRQNKLLEELDQSLLLMEVNARKKQTKDLIGSYIDGIDFEKLRNLIHSLIEWILIKHQKRNGKTGFFIIQIKYKGYDEISHFITDWKANDWYWTQHYKSNKKTTISFKDKQEHIEAYDHYDFDSKITERQWQELQNSNIYEAISLSEHEIVYFD